MVEERIDSYLDLAALKKETDTLLDYISALEKAKSDLSKAVVSIGVSGNSREAVKAADDIVTANTKVRNSVSELQKAQEALIKAQSEEAKQVALLKARKDELIRKNKEEAQSLAGTEAARKREAKDAELLANDYKQLSLAYNEAALKAKNLALQQGSNTPAAKAAFAEANALGNKLKEVDELTGKYNRNVGNYASAFTGYANTLRGIRGPVKLLGEALGVGAQEADQFRIILEHSFQAIAAFFRGKEAKAAAEKTDTAATLVNTAANDANTASIKENAAAISSQSDSSTSIVEATIVENANTSSINKNTIATDVNAVATKKGTIITEESAVAGTSSTVSTNASTGAINKNTIATTSNAVALESSGIALKSNAVGLNSSGVALRSNAVALNTNTVATGEFTVAQEGLAVATTSSSTAMKLFRAALIATGIGIVIGIIAYAVSKFIEYKSAVKDAAKAQEDLNEALKSDGYKTAIENFEKLKINIGLAKDGLLDKKEVLKEYNDTLGKTTGKVSDLNEAESILVNKGDAYIEMMLLQAAANIALEKAAQKAVEAEEIRQKKRKEFQNTFSDARVAQQGTFNAQEYDAETKRIEAAQEKRKAEAVKAKADEAKAGLDIATQFQKDAAKIAKTNNFDFFGGEEDEKKRKEKKQKVIKEVQSLFDRIVEMEKVFNSRDKPLGAPDETKANALRDLIIKNTSASIDKIVNTSKAGYVKDLENLKASLDQGLITREEYEKKVAELKKGNEREDLDNAIALNEAIISNLKARGLDTLEYEKKLNDLKAKLYEDDAKNQQIADDKKKKGAEELLKAKEVLSKKEVELGKDVADLLTTLVTASIQNERNAIIELEDNQQLNYENEVKRINASALSDQQKEQQLNNLKAQRDADKSKNDRDQRDLQTRQAKFERLTAVAKIIAATATAEVQALTYLSNPFTAPLYPAIAGIIAATGAVQLATLLATPLPKFRYGKGAGNSYEGFAEVGDGNVSEVIQRENGKIEVTPDRSTLAYLKRNDIVYPSIEAFRNRVAMSKTDKVLSNGVLVHNQANLDTKPLERKLDGVIAAYNSRPVIEQHWNERGVYTTVRNGNSQTEYINKYVKGM